MRGDPPDYCGRWRRDGTKFSVIRITRPLISAYKIESGHAVWFIRGQNMAAWLKSRRYNRAGK